MFMRYQVIGGFEELFLRVGLKERSGMPIDLYNCLRQSLVKIHGCLTECLINSIITSENKYINDFYKYTIILAYS
jgi:hypothetical protein